MERRESMDALGAAALVLFAATLAGGQVVIKLVNEGLQPIFFAGLRSAGAALVLWAWMVARRAPPRFERALLWPGLGIGLIFSAEFLCLFIALDLTTVTHAAVIFYSMPVWLALMAHVLLPGERLTGAKVLGLALAVAGIAWAILPGGGGGGQASLGGDLLTLGAALCWAGIALMARGTRLREVAPEMQLMWQLAVSAPLLLALSPLLGPLVRDFQPWHLWGIAFQIAVVSTAAFLAWFWLLRIYPAASVASFSFLSPIIGIALGWLLLGEPLGPELLGAAGLVAAGLVLINRPAPPPVSGAAAPR